MHHDVIDAAAVCDPDYLSKEAREARARRVLAAQAKPETIPDGAVEAAARVLCVEDGRDPDALDASFICDAGNKALPAWRWYEAGVRAALSAALTYIAKEGE